VVSVVGSFKSMSVPVLFNYRRFWEHCTLTACLARTIAREHRATDPEFAFDVGLMHDIGKLILACYAPEELSDIVETASTEGLSFHDAERAVMQTTHAEIGGWLARRWNFSPELVHGITSHHEEAGGTEEPLIAVCQFANALCKAKGFRTVGSHEKVSLPRGVRECLGITDGDVTQLFAAADQEIERSKHLLTMITA
jgi:putative nucleotidyltransferase with HDIG domain